MILGAVYHTILAILFAAWAILLMIVVLLQRGKGVGLAGAFGGTGGGTAFGAKTGDVLTWVTVFGAVVLLTFTIVLNYIFRESGPGLGPSPGLQAPPGTPPGAGDGATESPAVPENTAPAPAAPAEPTTGWRLEMPLPPIYAAQTIFGEPRG